MSVLQIVKGLKSSVTTGQDPFVTYKEFAHSAGLNEKYPPAWANRSMLDEAGQLLKSDPEIGLDLTFLLRSARSRYPSVIGGKRYDRNDLAQKVMARDAAYQIIDKFGLNFRNPY
jgi:hypothetical protein